MARARVSSALLGALLGLGCAATAVRIEDPTTHQKIEAVSVQALGVHVTVYRPGPDQGGPQLNIGVVNQPGPVVEARVIDTKSDDSSGLWATLAVVAHFLIPL